MANASYVRFDYVDFRMNTSINERLLIVENGSSLRLIP